MQILFAISILSFCALAWAAFAMTRHVRRNSGSRPLDSTPDPMLEKIDPADAKTRVSKPRQDKVSIDR